jgi:hypothetical protein
MSCPAYLRAPNKTMHRSGRSAALDMATFGGHSVMVAVRPRERERPTLWQRSLRAS